MIWVILGLTIWLVPVAILTATSIYLQDRQGSESEPPMPWQWTAIWCLLWPVMAVLWFCDKIAELLGI